jgi:DNA-binding transcriptional LysR family regulator
MGSFDIDFEMLRCFSLVAQFLSMTQAAEEMQVSLNTISQRISRLEVNLGFRLFERSTRRLTLSKEGLLFLPKAQNLLMGLNSGLEEIRAERKQVSGVINLGIDPGAVSSDFMRGLRLLLQGHPQVELRVHVLAHQKDLNVQKMDYGVLTGTVANSDLIAHSLGRSRWQLCADPRYLSQAKSLLKPEYLKEHNCLRIISYPEQNHWLLVNQKSGESKSFRLGGRFLSADGRVLKEALYAGLGVGVLPEKELRTAISEKKLERVLPDWHLHEVPIWFVYSSAKSRTKTTEVLRVLLQKAVTDLF